MKNKDNIKFVITLLLFLIPVFSEELKKYPSLAWASAGLGSIVALMTNARGVFLIRNLVNLIFPEYSISFERTITQNDLDSLIRMVNQLSGASIGTEVPLDGKVHGSLYKNKDGEKIPADEFIVFRPQDNAFFLTLPVYLSTCIQLGADETQIKAIRHLIEKVAEWRKAHPDRCKVPDYQVGEVPKGW